MKLGTANVKMVPVYMISLAKNTILANVLSVLGAVS